MMSSSNPKGIRFIGLAAGKEILQRNGAVRVISPLIFIMLALAIAATSWGQNAARAAQQPEESQFGAINPYLGLTIDEVELTGVSPEEASTLLASTPLKVGEPLTRQMIHEIGRASCKERV